MQEENEEMPATTAAAHAAQQRGAGALGALHAIADSLQLVGLGHVMHAAAGATAEAHAACRLAGFAAGEFLAEAVAPARAWSAAVPLRFLQAVVGDEQVRCSRPPLSLSPS